MCFYLRFSSSRNYFQAYTYYSVLNFVLSSCCVLWPQAYDFQDQSGKRIGSSRILKTKLEITNSPSIIILTIRCIRKWKMTIIVGGLKTRMSFNTCNKKFVGFSRDNVKANERLVLDALSRAALG